MTANDKISAEYESGKVFADKNKEKERRST